MKQHPYPSNNLQELHSAKWDSQKPLSQASKMQRRWDRCYTNLAQFRLPAAQQRKTSSLHIY